MLVCRSVQIPYHSTLSIAINERRLTHASTAQRCTESVEARKVRGSKSGGVVKSCIYVIKQSGLISAGKNARKEEEEEEGEGKRCHSNTGASSLDPLPLRGAISAGRSVAKKYLELCAVKGRAPCARRHHRLAFKRPRSSHRQRAELLRRATKSSGQSSETGKTISKFL